MAEPVGPKDAMVVPRFAGLRTFARLPRIDEVQEAAIAVVGVPYDGAVVFRPGARFGPEAVRNGSLLLRPHHEARNLSMFARLQVADAGDVNVNPLYIDENQRLVHEQVAALMDGARTRVVAIGGDHSISLALCRAASERYGPLSLLQVDAHTDLWTHHFSPVPNVSHGTWTLRAVEAGYVDPARSVQIGLRGSMFDASDMDEVHRLGFTTCLAREIERDGIAAAIDRALQTLRPPVYVTFDIDSLDPAFAPGTGTPEIGGLTSREALELLRALPGSLDVVAADVVEVLPALDPSGITAIAGANMVYELVALVAESLLQ